MKKILYHYCSTETFYSIISNRTIWLSSLSLSNDTMEGKLVARTLEKLATEDGLNELAKSRLINSFQSIEENFDGLGFCLSEKEDLLSQWRGYAADATGLSIGFSTDYLEKLGDKIPTEGDERPLVHLHKVAYSQEDHAAHVKPSYDQLRKAIDNGAFKFAGATSLLDSRTEAEIIEESKRNASENQKLFAILFSLFPKLFLLKSNAFEEEREWRLLTHLVWGFSETCNYRPISGRIIPYRPYPLPDLEKTAIAKVVLGPKHITPISVVQSLLRKHGFSDAEVTRSAATYR